MPFYRLSVWVLLIIVMPTVLYAQTPAVDPRDTADRAPNILEPDFVTVNLPTTLRLPRLKSSSASAIGSRAHGAMVRSAISLRISLALIVAH